MFSAKAIAPIEAAERSEIDVAEIGGGVHTGGESTKRKTPANPEGLTPNVDTLAETPEQMLTRVLLPGETVLDTFDCFFPTFMLPRWKIVLLLVSTLGLYAFVLLFRAIRRFCYRIRCCTPDVVEFQRGKLAVTNKGRVICWSLDFAQKKIKRGFWTGCFIKMCCFCWGANCDPGVDYTGLIETKIYNALDIRQITQAYESQSACNRYFCCCWCCCIEYSCVVELSFSEFAHTDTAFGAMSTSPSTGFFGALVFAVGAVMRRVELTLGLSTDNSLYIFSKTEDMVHNGNVEATINDMNSLNKSIMNVLPPLPDVFVKNDELNAQEPNKFEIVKGFSGIVVVSTSGDIKVPYDWIPLLSGEQIITAHGELYKLKCWDWFLTIITLGIHYCCTLRQKRFERTALIQTNKRLIAMDICQREGAIPSHLGSFFVSCRSLFPGEVKGGYLSSQSRKDLIAGIDTLGGHISINFSQSGQKGLPFAKSLMMTTSRLQSHVSIERVRDAPSFDATALNYLPLLPKEVPFDAVYGKSLYRPCCYVSYFCPGYLCEKGKFCFPWLALLLACCIRPLKSSKDIVITDMTVFSYVMDRNWGIFGCFGELCPGTGGLCCNKSSFSISWAPILSLTGFKSRVEMTGSESFCSRICLGNILGKVCCPIGHAALTVDVDLGMYRISVSDAGANKNWNKDEKLLMADAVLGRVQQEIILREHSSGKQQV